MTRLPDGTAPLRARPRRSRTGMAALAVVVTGITAMTTWPHGAHACAVCFAGSDESRTAFIATFVLMSSLPLAAIGTLVYWLRKRFRALDEGRPLAGVRE